MWYPATRGKGTVLLGGTSRSRILLVECEGGALNASAYSATGYPATCGKGTVLPGGTSRPRILLVECEGGALNASA
ncbi:hypothetical protein NDU88_006168 [Pleurodeles waltl]|uniref:Uncharacterized protein n=1 Tax=Pleurodeles waltl TaxID=8319 RepID=A0AAV7RPD0_PLEWA|nr:hypothetical protein NDU88_006168 [Pleurodeles waltl]